MEKQPNPGVPRPTTGDWQNTEAIQNRDFLLQYLLWIWFSEKQFFKKIIPVEHPAKKYTQKKGLFATANIKIKNFYLTKMKAKINFPEYEKNVGATTDLNSVHRL